MKVEKNIKFRNKNLLSPEEMRLRRRRDADRLKDFQPHLSPFMHLAIEAGLRP
ncbi:MAG: hypothetical protein IPJ71_02315 [Bdellovibrionales bacterium]|nr:hypothetical protein [Bdellovibrionales bacterium]